MKQNSDKISSRISDAELAERIRQDDSGAFKILFQRYCRPLIQFAFRYMQDIAVSENIVQDIFLALWTKRAGLDSSRSIKAFLYTSVKNHALKQLKHRHVREKHTVLLQHQYVAERLPDMHFEQDELSRAIHKAIDELPQKCRLIFCMNRFNHLSYHEIAVIQIRSVKTVETQRVR